MTTPPIPTVYELRKKGFKVCISHQRRYTLFNPFTGKTYTHLAPRAMTGVWNANGKPWALQARGGETHVGIIDQKGNEYKGIADCSKKDNYVRREGIRIALERAWNKLNGIPSDV